MEEGGLAHLDVYVLKRMYGYAGHIQRAVAGNSSHVVGAVLRHRDAEWMATMTALFRHQ